MFIKHIAEISPHCAQQHKIATSPIAFASGNSLLKSAAIESDTFLNSKINPKLSKNELVSQLVDLVKQIESRVNEHGITTFEKFTGASQSKIESITDKESGKLLQQNFFSGRVDVKLQPNSIGKVDVRQVPYDIMTKTNIIMPETENVILERYFIGFSGEDYGIDFDNRGHIDRLINPYTKELLQETEYPHSL